MIARAFGSFARQCLQISDPVPESGDAFHIHSAIGLMEVMEVKVKGDLNFRFFHPSSPKSSPLPDANSTGALTVVFLPVALGFLLDPNYMNLPEM